MTLSYLAMPLYPVVFILYTSGLLIESIMNLPTTMSKYYENQIFFANSDIYVDCNTYTKYTNFHMNCHEYKDYIFVIKNDELVKSHLMVNKKTRKMAYVVDNISVCDNIDKFKLTK